jgi:AcrR family transcriptional regulator
VDTDHGPLGAKGRARRDQVLRVAHDRLARRGLDGFVLREVAAGAGMTLGNLQYYFPTRDDLLEAVVRDEFARNLAAVRAAAAHGDLECLADDLLGQWAGEGGAVFTSLFQRAQQDGPGGRFGAVHQDVYRTFAAELAAVLRRHDPSAADADLLVRARVVTALLDGLAIQGYGADPDRLTAEERATRRAVTALVAGVAAGDLPAGGSG